MKQFNPETREWFEVEGPVTRTTAMQTMYTALRGLCADGSDSGADLWADPLVLATNADLLAKELVDLSDIALWTAVNQHGVSYTEAAVALGVSRQAVGSQLRRR